MEGNELAGPSDVGGDKGLATTGHTSERDLWLILFNRQPGKDNTSKMVKQEKGSNKLQQ